ncbi:hypothetical protein V3C99_019029, partial [Haemonchus contortus]
ANPLSNIPTPIHEEIDESDDEAEKRVLFVAQFYNFLELRGSPIEDAPLMGGKEIDLYALYNAVQELGGYNRVTKLQLWNEVLIKLNLQGNPDATPDTVKEAYVRHLSGFHAFSRSLRLSLGDVSVVSTWRSPRERRPAELFSQTPAKKRRYSTPQQATFVKEKSVSDGINEVSMDSELQTNKEMSVASTCPSVQKTSTVAVKKGKEPVPALSVDPGQVEQDEQAIIADAANEITNQGVEDSSGYDKRSPTAESVPARSEDRERAEQYEQATNEAGGNGTTNQGDEVGSGYATWKTKEKKVPVMKNSVLVDASYAMSAYGGFYSANGIDDGRPELEQDAQTQCSDDIFESCSPIFEEPTIREVVEIVETTSIDSVVHRCSQQPSSSKVICPSCSAAQSDANCSMDYQEGEVLLEGPEVVVKTEGNDYENVVDEDMEEDLDLDIDLHRRMVEVVTPMEQDFETEIVEQENNSDTGTYYVDSPSLYSKQPIVKKNIGLCDILQLANVKLEKLEK